MKYESLETSYFDFDVLCFHIHQEPGIISNMMGFIITPPATVPAAIKKVDDKLHNIENF